MKAKHTQRHHRTHKSRINRFGIIIFFLIFAAVTFYFTFKTDKLERVSSSPKSIDNDLYPGLHDYGGTSVQTPHRIPETLSFATQSKNIKYWDEIVIQYYQGKDVLTELEQFKPLIQTHKASQNIDQLIANIRTFGPYNPVDIYREIETLKERLELQVSEIKFQGFFGETLNKFVTIRRFNTEDEILKKMNSIENMVKNQNYVESYNELRKLQTECQCIENHEFILLTRQKNTNDIITDISNEIGATK